MSLSASAKGVGLGIVGLSALDLLIASKNGPKVFGTIATTPAAWLNAWFDPARPLIPDLRSGAGSSSSNGGGGAKPNCDGLFGDAKKKCQQQGTPKCVPAPGVPGGDAYCAGVNGDCSKLSGFTKVLCETTTASATQPNTSLPPASSTARALSA